MAEYTVNSELSGSESKHDGQAMPEGHRWTKVMPDAEGAAACWACGSRHRERCGLEADICEPAGKLAPGVAVCAARSRFSRSKFHQVW